MNCKELRNFSERSQ